MGNGGANIRVVPDTSTSSTNQSAAVSQALQQNRDRGDAIVRQSAREQQMFTTQPRVPQNSGTGNWPTGLPKMADGPANVPDTGWRSRSNNSQLIPSSPEQYTNSNSGYEDEAAIQRANQRQRQAEEAQRQAAKQIELAKRNYSEAKEQDEYWKRATNRIYNWGDPDPWRTLNQKIEQWKAAGEKPDDRPTVLDTGETTTTGDRKQRDREELKTKRGYRN